jgi:hypothetical protein
MSHPKKARLYCRPAVVERGKPPRRRVARQRRVPLEPRVCRGCRYQFHSARLLAGHLESRRYCLEAHCEDPEELILMPGDGRRLAVRSTLHVDQDRPSGFAVFGLSPSGQRCAFACDQHKLPMVRWLRGILSTEY